MRAYGRPGPGRTTRSWSRATCEVARRRWPSAAIGGARRMVQVRYWEDVQVGEELPGYALLLDPLRLHLQSSGTQDFHRQHNDEAFARQQGAGGIFVNTGFMHAALSRVLLDWMGDEGFLQSFRMDMR